MRTVIGMLSLAMMILAPSLVCGQTYPSKPVRIVTSAIGGGTDFVARIMAQGLSGLGQPVVVDNRVSIIAGELVSKAPPDGYTLLVASGALWVVSLLQKVPYDPVRDFSPISLATSSPNILLVHPSLPVKSVKELIALAKAKPGELNYASAGAGSSLHLAGELFKYMAGVNILHVPFKGSGAALNGVLGGETQLIFSSTSSAAPHVTSGRLRALGLTGAQPSPALAPGVPTIAASGLPGYEFISVDGVLAPAKTPAAIINRLNQEIVRILALPDVKEKFLKAGADAGGSSPDEFAAAMKSDLTTLGKLIKDVGIKVE